MHRPLTLATASPVSERSFRRCVVAAIAVFAVSLCASSSIAQGTAQASMEFDRATKAAARGDYAEAAAAFEQAYRLAPHGATLFNAALAWQAAGDAARAADAYAGALDRGGLADSQEKDARKRLKELESRLGRLDLSGPEGTLASIAQAERVPLPARVHVDRGRHEVRFWLPDGRVERRVVTAGASPLEVRCAPVGEPAPTKSAPPGPERVREETPLLSSSVAGWSAIGAGAVLGGATTWLGLKALSARDEFNASGHTDAGAHDRAESLRTWTNVTLAGAAVMTGLGVYVLVRRPAPDSRASSMSAGPRIQLGLASVQLSGQF